MRRRRRHRFVSIDEWCKLFCAVEAAAVCRAANDKNPSICNTISYKYPMAVGAVGIDG